MILSFLELRNLIGVLQEEPASANSFTLKTQLCYSYSENALNVSVVTKSFKLVISHVRVTVAPTFTIYVDDYQALSR